MCGVGPDEIPGIARKRSTTTGLVRMENHLPPFQHRFGCAPIGVNAQASVGEDVPVHHDQVGRFNLFRLAPAVPLVHNVSRTKAGETAGNLWYPIHAPRRRRDSAGSGCCHISPNGDLTQGAVTLLGALRRSRRRGAKAQQKLVDA